jgi:hypothetical protein
MRLRVRGETGNHYLAVRAVGRIVSSMEIHVALATCRQPSNLRRTLTIALIVGCILSIINQGDVIVHGDATGATLKVCLNFVVPFVVSNLGVLTDDRTARA